MPTDTETHFSEMKVPRPSMDDVKGRYRQLQARLESEEPGPVVEAWDGMRRHLGTYRALTNLHFNRDTSDPEAKEERDFANEEFPRLTDFNVGLKRRLLERRDELEGVVSDHVFELWKCDIAAFQPEIEDDLVAQNKIRSRHTEMLGAAEIEFRGETYNMSTIRKFATSNDRPTRHDAAAATWGWIGRNREKFDQNYDQLVGLRHQMATKLGFENFVPLGYLDRHRIDYTADDVARFREEVRREVVPLTTAIVEDQARRLGVDKVMKWDEAVFSPDGGPKLQLEGEELIEAAQTMFDRMHPELGDFFQTMRKRGLMDLEARPNKAPGGFCTSLEAYGTPFVYANFKGTRGDVEVFTHEMGHAFQCYLSIDKFPMDLVWPTFDAAEIHSMSLEFLCWPHMDLFFGDDAERFRYEHLADSLTFLPYGCAVDHFQHLVYENPEASIDDRYDMWLQVKEMYLPWRDWGDIEHGARGGRWHAQTHVFSAPFYYIDYVLAQTCALQFWARAQEDADDAMESYVTLCRRGGEAPFQELARSAGLRSPFEPGCLEDAVSRAKDYLRLDG